MQPFEEQARLLLDPIQNNHSICKLGFDRDPDRLTGNLKELFGQANEFFDRQRAVSFVRRGLQRE